MQSDTRARLINDFLYRRKNKTYQVLHLDEEIANLLEPLAETLRVDLVSILETCDRGQLLGAVGIPTMDVWINSKAAHEARVKATSTMHSKGMTAANKILEDAYYEQYPEMRLRHNRPTAGQGRLPTQKYIIGVILAEAFKLAIPTLRKRYGLAAAAPEPVKDQQLVKAA